MSKSKGNVIAPQNMIQKYSADALRFWAAGAKLGEDQPFKEQDLQNGIRFITKMWNSFKFFNHIISQEENENFDPTIKPKLLPQDRWLLDKVNELIKLNTDSFDKYEFDKVKYRLDQFFWAVFCDSYIELVKDRMYKPDIYGKDAQLSGFYTYYHGLKAIMQMTHPFIPFATESFWQYFLANYEKEKSVINSEWPKPFDIEILEDEKYAGQLAVDITSIVRKFKSDNQKPLNSDIKLRINCSDEVKKQIELISADIKGTTKAISLEFVEKDAMRIDIAFGEEESKEKDIEADEPDIAKKILFLAIDIDFVEKEE